MEYPDVEKLKKEWKEQKGKRKSKKLPSKKVDAPGSLLQPPELDSDEEMLVNDKSKESSSNVGGGKRNRSTIGVTVLDQNGTLSRRATGEDGYNDTKGSVENK